MGSFSYIAFDKNGKKKKGVMEAIDETKVMYSLRIAGYIPIQVMEQNLLTRDLNISFNKFVSERELGIFCRQFGGILASGVSVTTALHMLEKQTEKKAFRMVIKQVYGDVERGETVADAMRRHGKIFPPILINMIEAGEKSGSLENSLQRSALHFEKDARLKWLMRRAMIYPCIVTCVAVIVIIIILAKVIPQFFIMFDQMDVKMPVPTQIVINMSNFIKVYWYIILAGFLAILIGVHELKSLPNVRRYLDKISLRIPIFGKLIKKNACAQFSRTLSSLLRTGISLMEALDIVARTISNVIIKEAILEARLEVERGVPLSLPLKDSGFFPPMIYHMIGIGEETGNLEEILESVAEYYEEEVEMATQSVSVVIEPLIIVFLAIIVGFLVISIILPMYSLYNGVSSL